VFNHNWCQRFFLFDRRTVDCINDFESADDLSESGKLTIECGRVSDENKEVGRSLVGFIGPGKRDHPTQMLDIVWFVRHSLRSTLGTFNSPLLARGEIATLDYELWDHPAEGSLIKRARCRQIEEIPNRFRRRFAFDFHQRAAKILGKILRIVADEIIAKKYINVGIAVDTDRGLLVVCDSRMAGMNYGKRLREALPPMTMVATEAEALEWLGTLAGAALPF